MVDLLKAGLPLMVLAVLAYGWVKGVAVYDVFVEGAKQGLMTALGIVPYLCAALLLIGIVRSSGLLELLTSLLSQPMAKLGLPEGTLPLLLMRPISGSASLAILEDIMKEYGADSFTGRVAAAMMGSTETVLYTVAIYLGAAKVKGSRGIIPVSLLATFVGAVVAGVAVRLFY